MAAEAPHADGAREDASSAGAIGADPRSATAAGSAAAAEPVCTEDPPALAAAVAADGTLEQRNGAAGVALIRAHPELERYLHAFVRAPVVALRASFVAGPDWIGVHALREDGGGASVELTPEPAPPYGLTVRELDVLTLLAGGLSNPEIAVHLDASPRTISTHVYRVMGKLDVGTRTGAGAIAVEQGLLRIPLPAPGRSVDILAVGAVAQVAEGRTVAPRGRRRAPRVRPYLVGSALPLDGPLRAEGIEMQRGSRLAIDEINRHGGIAGRPLRQVVVPVDACAPGSFDAALDALLEAEVDAITMGYSLVDDRASYAAVGAYGAPLLNAMTSEAQTEWVREDPDTLGRVFQVDPTERHYGLGFVRFLDQLRETTSWSPANRRLLVVETDTTGGHVLRPEVVAAAVDAGWEVDRRLVVALRGADWEPTLAAIREREPAAVLVAHFLPDELAGLLRRVAEDGPLASLLYAVHAPSVPAFLETAGASAEGLLWATVTGNGGDPIAADFERRYRQSYGAAPGRTLAGLAYDQVGLLVNAWSRVGNPRAFARVAAELRRGHHRGVNGSYVLGHDRQCGLSFPFDTPDASLGQAQLVFQIQDGRQRVLSPGTYAEAPFRTPPWSHAAGALAR